MTPRRDELLAGLREWLAPPASRSPTDSVRRLHAPRDARIGSARRHAGPVISCAATGDVPAGRACAHRSSTACPAPEIDARWSMRRHCPCWRSSGAGATAPHRPQVRKPGRDAMARPLMPAPVAREMKRGATTLVVHTHAAPRHGSGAPWGALEVAPAPKATDRAGAQLTTLLSLPRCGNTAPLR